MRAWWMVLLLVPLAGAAVEDEAGDQVAGYYPGHWEDEPAEWVATGEQGWYQYVDILSGGILEETPYELVFGVEVASPDSNGEPQVHDNARVDIDFTFHGEAWRVSFHHPVDSDEATAYLGRVETLDAGDPPVTRHDIVASAPADVDGGVWEATFAKEIFRDASFVPLRAGEVLDDIHLSAYGRNNYRVAPCATNDPANCWKARDEAPGPDRFTVESDPPGVGHLFAQSDAPLRGSNGVGTTYLYTVAVTNTGSVDDTTLVQVGGQPGDWTIRAPARVPVPAGESVEVPIAVTVPFRHVHGDEQLFDVRFQSSVEEGIEAVQSLGVVWHAVPQPGGHHPDVHFHGDGYGVWFNTLADDPDDESTGRGLANNVRQSSDLDSIDYDLRWFNPLSPRLLMGLDVDSDGRFTGTTTFDAPTDIEGEAHIAFLLGDADGFTELASGSQPFSFTAGTNAITWDLGVAPDVDRFPYDEHQLYIDTQLVFSTEPDRLALSSGSEQPALLTPETSYRLPLQDYHDIIDEDLLASLSRLALRADGEASREVNPGDLVAFTFTVANTGDRTATVDWDIEGDAADWAEVFPDASTVAAGANASVLVTVEVPEDAADGRLAELLLIGADRRDPDAQVFGRILASVTTATDVPDDRERVDGLRAEAEGAAARDTPMPLWLVLSAMAIVLRRR